MSRIILGAAPPPSAELVALRVFADTMRYLYRRGGFITRAKVRAALDTLDAQRPSG